MEGSKSEVDLDKDTEKTGLIDNVMDVDKPSIGGDQGQVFLAPNPVISKPKFSHDESVELLGLDRTHEEEASIVNVGGTTVKSEVVSPVGLGLDVTKCETDSTPNLPSDPISSPPKPKVVPALIANYGSDSYDSDDNVDNENPSPDTHSNTPAVILPVPVPMELQTDYRTIEPSSEDSDSDSSESTDEESSSSSSPEPSEGVAKKKKNTAKVDNDVVVDAEEITLKQVPRTRGEVTLDDLPPIADLQISVPEESCLEMGFISSIVEQQVVVQAKQNFPPLNLETVLFLDKGKRPLGAIFDVLGQVSEPYYSVRFNSSNHVKEKDIKPGMVVYYVPNSSEHTSYVFVDQLMTLKGTDSSWEHNNEPPPACLDYSDDEAEISAKRLVTGTSSQHHVDSFDDDQPPRKRVNSFERRMNERNLRKSALPPEPRNVFSGLVRGANIRNKRSKNPNPFAGQQRPSRPTGPAFPPPNTSSQPMGYQPRPTSWESVTLRPNEPMGYGQSPVNPQRVRPGLFNQGRGFNQGGGYGFSPIPSQPMPFHGMGCGLPVAQHDNLHHMRFASPSNSPQGVVHAPALGLAYTMGSPMQPNANAHSMAYPSGFMHNAQRSPFPVLLRPARFQGGPPRYDTSFAPQSMPFGSPPPPAFTPCYPNRPPMRAQAYNPMFAGVPMFNPGFPPPQLPPRGNMYSVGPPPPPRGGV